MYSIIVRFTALVELSVIFARCATMVGITAVIRRNCKMTL